MSKRSATGIVTVVQDSRFQLTGDDGVGHLFILGANAAAEPSQLIGLQHGQARVRVWYKPAPNVVGDVATIIQLLD